MVQALDNIVIDLKCNRPVLLWKVASQIALLYEREQRLQMHGSQACKFVFKIDYDQLLKPNSVFDSTDILVWQLYLVSDSVRFALTAPVIRRSARVGLEVYSQVNAVKYMLTSQDRSRLKANSATSTASSQFLTSFSCLISLSVSELSSLPNLPQVHFNLCTYDEASNWKVRYQLSTTYFLHECLQGSSEPFLIALKDDLCIWSEPCIAASDCGLWDGWDWAQRLWKSHHERGSHELVSASVWPDVSVAMQIVLRLLSKIW